MYPIILPGTRELGPEFADSDIIMIRDHMPLEAGPSANSIIDLFNDAGLDYRDRIFITDSYMCFDDFEGQIVYLNNFLIKETQLFVEALPNWSTIPEYDVTYKLSTMMNKARINREILSVVLANLFNEQDILYTCAEKPGEFVGEYFLGTKYKFNTDLTLSQRWLGETERYRHGEDFYGDNVRTFRDILFEQLYKHSAVTLITEPLYYEKGFMMTEKSIMAIYSGHFMIWVGGWRSAETAKKMGFDVFEDIIDHSYQYLEDPAERCVEAVLRNMELLNDVKLQQELRGKMSVRLNQNLSLIRDIDLIKKITAELNDFDLYEKYSTVGNFQLDKPDSFIV